ncbi:unnamed protein product [Macrosiphum euphorbiae]|uniref:Protein kinase domain-containing protein n=1 Tax=Macrosiphum euphorbiae TaxID=13131 RepID=A0AAV0WB77_9HEMI|nr:unnamed protein product [Macrosiphum euphorbiae]
MDWKLQPRQQHAENTAYNIVEKKIYKMERLETLVAQTSVIQHPHISSLRAYYTQADGKISKIKSIEVCSTNSRRISWST